MLEIVEDDEDIGNHEICVREVEVIGETIREVLQCSNKIVTEIAYRPSGETRKAIDMRHIRNFYELPQGIEERTLYSLFFPISGDGDLFSSTGKNGGWVDAYKRITTPPLSSLNALE